MAVVVDAREAMRSSIIRSPSCTCEEVGFSNLGELDTALTQAQSKITFQGPLRPQPRPSPPILRSQKAPRLAGPEPLPDMKVRREMYPKEQWLSLKPVILQLYVDEGQTSAKWLNIFTNITILIQRKSDNADIAGPS